jgi:hypothetical protein
MGESGARPNRWAGRIGTPAESVCGRFSTTCCNIVAEAAARLSIMLAGGRGHREDVRVALMFPAGEA